MSFLKTNRVVPTTAIKIFSDLPVFLFTEFKYNNNWGFPMDVTIIGLSHVGLADALVLGSYFNHVIAFDLDKEKISLLREGVSPFEEPFVQDLLKETKTYVRFTSNIKDTVRPSSLISISVDTSFNEDGTFNLTSYYEALDLIAENATRDCYIFIRSFVPPGTNRKTKKYLEEHSEFKFNVISMPSFGSQGNLVESLVTPSRVILGVDSPETGRATKQMLAQALPKKIPLLITSPENVELIKFSNNLYVGMHVSFINSLARLADVYSANIDTISAGLAMDPRVNGELLHASMGYGGPILPFSITKDPEDKEAIDYYSSDLFRATIHSNSCQIKYFIDKIYERYRSVSAKKIAILGASFKAGTEDIYNSPALYIMRFLLDKGAYIQLYDPLAEDKVQKYFSRHTHISYFDYPKDAMKGADLVLILTDAKEFKELTAQDFKECLRKPIIIDGKNLFSLQDMDGTEYHSIGRRTVALKSLLDD